MIHVTRATVAAASMAAILAAGGSASRAPAAEWQTTYLKPAVQAWMGVVTLLGSDSEREDEKDDDSKCDGDCEKDCKKCDHKRGGDGPHGKHMHRHGPRDGHMGPHADHGPRGDAVKLLHDINARLARIERMLAARGQSGPPMAGHGHGGHHGKREAMEGPKKEAYQRMSAAREKWQNASPEERAEMKEKMEARMKEGREKMAAVREKWQNASPEERAEMKEKMEARMKEGRERMSWTPKEGERSPKAEAMRPKAEEGRSMIEAARKRAAELEHRVKRLEAELERVKEALIKSRDS